MKLTTTAERRIKLSERQIKLLRRVQQLTITTRRISRLLNNRGHHRCTVRNNRSSTQWSKQRRTVREH
ncbi:hypothetical protein ANAPC5_00806 [Anaplasma phagocytophilum]|nr:hypothetical protein ANAPC5_00806 [Anaplasma phagocytophilum]